MIRRLGPLLTGDGVGALQQQGHKVRFVDASWYLDPARDGEKEFAKERLPGAFHFDIDAISNQSSPLPHMLPTESQFADTMNGLGVSNSQAIVVYGGENCLSAARCWWTFKYFGHQDVFILNGGLAQWKREGREVDSSPFDASWQEATKYTARSTAQLLRTSSDILEVVNSSENRPTIVDARSAARFFGEAPEPRQGLLGGHMPSAVCVPFTKLVQDDDFATFREKEDIQQAFSEAGVDISADAETTIITTCGSGVTASVLTFGLHLLGKPLHRVPVYDGSWSEWGGLEGCPVVTDRQGSTSYVPGATA